MITKKIKQSKIAKFLVLLTTLTVIYAITGFLLILLAGNILQFGRATFSTKNILISGGLFFLLFICAYVFIFRSKKMAKYKIIQRILMYALFFGFAAVTVFTILIPAINYIDFLRFRMGNYSSVFLGTTFFLGLACFITYTIFTSLIEMQKNKNNILRQLIYWLVATIAAGYSSLLVLFFYTGFDYQEKCLPKVGIASDYCYSIGESIYYWWRPIPGLVVFVIMMLFIILYFAVSLKKEEK